jgi:DNA repair exonuclease SbcCD ATPase subunit
VEELPDKMEKAFEELQSASKASKAKAIWRIVCIVVALMVGFSIAYLTLQDSIEASVSARHSAELSNKESEISLLKTQISDYIIDKDALEIRLKESSEGLNTEQNRDLESLQSDLAASEERLKALEAQFQALLNERSSLSDQLANREAKITEIVAEVDKWRKASEEADTKILALQVELKRATEAANGGVEVASGDTEKPPDCIEHRLPFVIRAGEMYEVCGTGGVIVSSDRITYAPYISINGTGRASVSVGSSVTFLPSYCTVVAYKVTEATPREATIAVDCGD